MGGKAEEFKRKLGSQDAKIFRITKARYSIFDRIMNVVSSKKEPV
jgi:hypothetical protein